MKITTLLENERIDKKFRAAHGLSLYIEALDKKILFDIGPNNYYIKNAKQLGIDLSEVDILVVSHGHYDHGSGLSKFIKLNKTAKIYLSIHAFEEHIKENGKEIVNIGIKEPSKRENLVLISKKTEILPGINIYTDVRYKNQIIGDSDLKVYIDGQFIADRFKHEIYLVIEENNKLVLFSGCSHKGIENIIDSIEKKHNLSFTHIVGGFHFSHYDSFNFKQTDYLQTLSTKFMKRDNTIFYTGHCTGNDAYFELKQKLKDNINRLKTGSEINI
jgi:7,8-dihydropterin-6-yl-methyl-4-(beta-D-ribofuranosyl)aminobenzene 5'-phosphate synthase